MRYLILIYRSEAEYAKLSPQEMGAEGQGYMAFAQEAHQKGAMLGGEALMPTNTATTLCVRDGKNIITDGPFAETKEQLGGYYLLNCKDLDEAIEYAAKLPAAKSGSIEIRPILEMNK